MLFQPALEEGRDGPRQAQNDKARRTRARISGRFQDRRHLVIGDRRNDRRDHHAGRDTRGGELFDCVQAQLRRGSARLHDARELFIERGDRNRNGCGVVFGQLAENVDVARDEMVFRDDGDRIAKLGQDG